MIIFKREKKALIRFKQYIEGDIDFDTFWNEYISNGDLMKYLCRFDNRRKETQISKKYIDYFYNGEPRFHLRARIQESIVDYLNSKKIKFVNNTKEFSLWKKWYEYIPSFVPIDDEGKKCGNK